MALRCRRMHARVVSMLQAAPSSISSSAGAAGADSPAAAVASTSGRPETFNVTRTFSWQEKVYSKAELVAAQVTGCLFCWCVWSVYPGCWYCLGTYALAWGVYAQAQHQATKQQGRPACSPRRTARFGSQTHIGTDRLLVSGHAVAAAQHTLPCLPAHTLSSPCTRLSAHANHWWWFLAATCHCAVIPSRGVHPVQLCADR